MSCGIPKVTNKLIEFNKSFMEFNKCHAIMELIELIEFH